MDELLGTRAQPERWSRFGSLCAEVGNRGTDGTISDVHVISIVWLLMIGDFQSKGNFPSVPRHSPAFPAFPGIPGTFRVRETSGTSEKEQFPVSGFSGGWDLALGSGKRRLSEKKLRFGVSRIGGCDKLCPFQQPKWKSWLREDQRWSAKASSRLR